MLKQALKRNSTQRPDVFRYHDYRLFITDYTTFLKGEDPRFSLRSLARKAKLSCAYLPLVLAKKRPLSADALQRILPALRLTPQEGSYLELLRRTQEGDNGDLKAQAVERMQRFDSYKKANPKEAETYRYLSRWYYVAIREMAQWNGFRLDPQWIQSKLRGKVSIHEIKQAIEFLTSNGFIQAHANGSVEVVDKNITCAGPMLRLALRQFHHEMLGVSLEAIDATPESEHHIAGYTLTLPKERIPELKEIFKEALKKIEALQENPAKKTSDVFHVCFLASPLTRNEGE